MLTLRVSRRWVALLGAALAAGRRIPAHAGALQATPSAGVDERLLEATFAAEELPAGAAQGFFYRLTLPPEEALNYLAGPFCGCPGQQVTPGVGAELVVSGSYAVRLDAPIRVRRSGGGEEEVEAGTEVILEPGDAAAFPDYGATGLIRASGDEPAVVVGLAVVQTAGSGTPAPKLPVGFEGEELATLSPVGWSDIATGEPVTIRLRRLELPPGSALGPYESSGADAMLVEAGEVEGNVLPPGATNPPGRPLPYREGSTVPFLILQPGNRRLVANAGDQPAVLLIATIAPAGEAVATPTATG